MSEVPSELLQRVKRFRATLPDTILAPASDSSVISVYPDDVLPFELYRGTRDNIVRIGDQINQAYHFGVFDGCAVLMRRLIEMLLILSFKAHKIEEEIRGGDGNYLHVTALTHRARASKDLSLSRKCKEHLEEIVERGHLSAHSPFFNARKKDIDQAQYKFRQIIEELLYKAEILK